MPSLMSSAPQATVDDKYYFWSHLFDSLVLKDCGIQDLQPKTLAHHEPMAQDFYYTIMSDEELKVMLQGVFATRAERIR